jgi:hypothetical protein
MIADITDPDLIRKILEHVDNRAPPRTETPFPA